MSSLADTIWCPLVASILLTPLAVVTGSWFIMWVATLLSAYVSFLDIFTIGALTFLLTCLQLIAAIALRQIADGSRCMEGPAPLRSARLGTDPPRVSAELSDYRAFPPWTV